MTLHQKGQVMKVTGPDGDNPITDEQIDELSPGSMRVWILYRDGEISLPDGPVQGALTLDYYIWNALHAQDDYRRELARRVCASAWNDRHGCADCDAIAEADGDILPPACASHGDSCPDHWHCDPALAAHMCDRPNRAAPCPTCGRGGGS